MNCTLGKVNRLYFVRLVSPALITVQTVEKVAKAFDRPVPWPRILTRFAARDRRDIAIVQQLQPKGNQENNPMTLSPCIQTVHGLSFQTPLVHSTESDSKQENENRFRSSSRSEKNGRGSDKASDGTRS